MLERCWPLAGGEEPADGTGRRIHKAEYRFDCIFPFSSEPENRR
jgi:hypothetical protein